MRPRSAAALLFLATLWLASHASAQGILSGRDWELATGVEYRGGDRARWPRARGTLVLDDTVLTLRRCFADCLDPDRGEPAIGEILLRIPLASVLSAEASITRLGPSAARRWLFGPFARDRREGYVAVTYRSGATVEVPIFKTADVLAPALAAKIRVRAARAAAAP